MSRRYALRNPGLFKQIMEHPGTGVPYSYRSLADAAGCSHGLVDGLIAGRQKTASMEAAHSLSEALGVGVLVLFMPPTSPNQNASTTNPLSSPKE